MVCPPDAMALVCQVVLQVPPNAVQQLDLDR
jgi:hypothetical protein